MIKMRAFRKRWKQTALLAVLLMVLFFCWQVKIWIEDDSPENLVFVNISGVIKPVFLKLNAAEIIKRKVLLSRDNTSCFWLVWNGGISKQILGRPCTYVTINSTAGRLGNQMFRIASLVGIAHRLGFVPVIPDLPGVSKWFQLPNTNKVMLKNSSTFATPDCCRYYEATEQLDPQVNWTLHGYLQSWRYFNEAQSFIRETFETKSNFFISAESFTRLHRLKFTTLVAIHIRRQDMTLQSSIKRGYITPGVDYIFKAMTYFQKTTRGSVLFVVISDDIKWCKNNVKGENITYSPFHDIGCDVALMSSCDHVIITSGTFGWWGGWLSGGSVVYFAGFPGKGSPVANETNNKDYYPPNWIGLE